MTLVFLSLNSSLSASTSKCKSGRRATGAGTPPASFAREPYETKPGLLNTTLSPSSTREEIAACRAPEPPAVIKTCFGVYSSPFSRFSLSATADRSSSIPALLVYPVLPSEIARMAAALIFSGVSKSGCPRPMLMAFGPAASNILRMPDISIDVTRFAKSVIFTRCWCGVSEVRSPQSDAWS